MDTKPTMSDLLYLDAIKLTMWNQEAGVEVPVYVVRRNVVAFHISVVKEGFTALYTTDGNVMLVRETPDQIALMK